MPKKIAVSTLQASTVDILNTIRANASSEYQNLVPEITTAREIPAVGEVLFGYPTLANQFLASLMNRIALVRAKSATFNNKFSMFKKGYLEFGETVEEIFVELAKVQRFDPDKAQAREFKRTLPDVRTAFHMMNWRVQYPVTVSHQQLRTAFTSENGVRDLIERIIQSIYTAAEYDEWLLTKYLIIKAVSKGKMKPIAIGNGDMSEAAILYRGASNQMEFMRTDYNEAGVHTATPKSRQYILMDSMYNARYDVSVLANAFNMEKADFKGKLVLVDSFTTFDNDRWAAIRAESDGIEEITTAELNLMAGVKAILLDEDWFQIYDNLTEMTETFVGSGMYWNYWLNTFKTVSHSPFANAVVFAEGVGAAPSTIKMVVDSVDRSEQTVITLVPEDKTGFNRMDGKHIQTQSATELGVAVHPFGAYIYRYTGADEWDIEVEIGDYVYTGKLNAGVGPGEHITLNKT